MKPRNKKIIKMLSFLVISILLLYILFSHVRIEDITELIKKIPLIWLLAGFLFYIACYVFRAMRFNLLLDKKIKIKRLFTIVCIHNMAVSLLPVRTGELSYIYLVKKEGIKGTKALATLLVARIFDFFALILIFFIAIFLIFSELPDIIKQIIPYVLILILAIILFVVFMFFFAEKLFHRKIKIKLINTIACKIKEVTHDFKILHTKKNILNYSILSLFIWLSQFIMIYVVIGKLIKIGFIKTVIGSILPIFSTVLPVQGLAGFGSTEGAWAIAFYSLGVSKSVAISSGFIFHFLLIIYFLIPGIIALLFYYKKK